MASVVLLMTVIASGLTAISKWAERDLQAFPFKNEDWLRYLLPTSFETTGRSRLMITGASTARENLRHEVFEAAFPDYDVFQGSFVYATFEDVAVSLEYVEKVYGAEALPAFMVFGIAPRVAANEPDDRPFTMGLNRYSPYYSAKQEPTRIVLEPKGSMEGLFARSRFLFSKSPERFRTGLLAVLNRNLNNGEEAAEGEPALAKAANGLLNLPGVGGVLGKFGYPELRDFAFQDVTQHLISPYKYTLDAPLEVPMVAREDYEGDDIVEWWPSVYFWDPKQNEAVTRARIKHFADFIERHGIRVLVVNLPEHEASRLVFDEADYQEYLEIVQSELRNTEFLDLRDFLDAADFHDREHTTTDGSIRLSNKIIESLRESMSKSQISENVAK